jgi:hypothetical protein
MHINVFICLFFPNNFFSVNAYPFPFPHAAFPLRVTSMMRVNPPVWLVCKPRDSPEPVFLNVYGAQESIPRNKFRQPM